MRVIRYFLSACLLILCFSSCNKDESTIPTFPISYKIYNNGEPSIVRISINYTTYHKNENSYHFFHMFYEQNAPNWNIKEAGYFSNSDSIEYTPKELIYSGCNYNLKMAITLIDKDGNEVEKGFQKSGIITSSENALIKFHWPEDTLNIERFDPNTGY